MGDVSLKLEGTNGDLKQVTTTEEQYFAYQAGLQLSTAADTEPGCLKTASSGSPATVGTFTDTRFNEAIGSHGTLTTSSTATTLYQSEGTAAEDGGDFRYPIEFVSNSGAELHEMTDAEVSALVDRLNSVIFTNDYPGTYKLATSAPSGDYTEKIAGLFTDTKVNSSGNAETVNTYNLYRRTAMTAPTAIRPVALKRSSGGSGTFQGIQEMSDAEIKYTFGQRAKTRIMNGSLGVGTYLIKSATQGAPTDTGTWVAKGAAVDTKNTTTNTDYTQDFVGDFGGIFTQDFVGNFTGNFETTFTGDFTNTFTRNSTQNFTRNSTATFTGDFTGNFASTFTGDFTGDFAGRNPGLETGVFDINANYNTSNYTRNSTTNFVGDFTRNSTTNFVGDFTGDFVGDFTGNFANNFTQDFVGTFTQDFTQTFTGDFSTNFTTTFTGNFLGALINNATETIETYTLYVRTA